MGFWKRPRTVFGILITVAAAIATPLLRRHGNQFYVGDFLGWPGGANAGSLIGATLGCVLWLFAPSGWLGKIHSPGGPPWGLAVGALVGGLAGYLGGGVSGSIATIFPESMGVIVYGLLLGTCMWGLVEFCTLEPEASGPGGKPLDPTTAVPQLLKLLQTQSNAVAHKFIINTLGQMGPAAKDAIPALRECLRDQDELVRQSASEALQRIGPDEQKSEDRGAGAPPAQPGVVRPPEQ